MKYIKTFENLSEYPNVGDYVICEEGNLNLKDFIENNIGQIYKKYAGRRAKYLVKYENAPDLSGFSELDGFRVRVMYSDEFIYLSSDRAELESILSANKYNL